MDSSEEKKNTCTTIILHPLANFSSSHPSVFVWDLKQNFIHGKGKSTAKFHAIRKQIIQSLPSSPAPGPATFVIHCLEALALIEVPYSEGLGHLLTSALNRVGMESRSPQDFHLAKKHAASLVCKALKGERILDPRIIVKTIEVFDVQMLDIAGALSITNDNRILQAENFIEPLVVSLIKSHSYNIATSLIKHLHLPQYSSQSFLARMVDDGDLRLAGQWASHLGKDMLCCLVQYCTSIGMFKEAYKYVQHYQLSDTFPEARHLCKRSSLPTVLVKGLWGRASSTLDEELHLPQDLRKVTLHSEGQGDGEESVALKPPSCAARLKNRPVDWTIEMQQYNIAESEAIKYIQITDVMPLEKIIWVDSLKELDFATQHLREASLVGIDCEWKAIREKTFCINKVSVLQIATREFVFILDLVSLSRQHGRCLSACIESIFCSPAVLKLGYAVYNDLEQLLQSYSELDCFHRCESVLDLQIVAGRGIKGGLSGLAKAVLGKSMDKRMRMTDWERRPLSMKQLHYAALDAAVLLPIFDHIDSKSGKTVSHIDWKLHVDHFKAQKTYLKPQAHEDDVESSSSPSQG
ncbi:hypothetical protein GOP47_0023863 [Adiantum capillus-veneris]|uniref:3'-5' exonuclease domain-containing protein n=1 Tax=Adiantum capillus-veneris TaxID=13818 RepID=A0A9D4Z3R7_ADICA|nr:hypothetical protein GOP47_0023863 [Adiantum capillus-veneris]